MREDGVGGTWHKFQEVSSYLKMPQNRIQKWDTQQARYLTEKRM